MFLGTQGMIAVEFCIQYPEQRNLGVLPREAVTSGPAGFLTKPDVFASFRT